MKNLSLKMEEDVFRETERITARISKNRNRYINEAVEFYNLLQKRKIISSQLKRESKTVREESMKVLSEFEKLQRFTYRCRLLRNNHGFRFLYRSDDTCSGLEQSRFDEYYEAADLVDMHNFKIRFLHYNQLIANKKATGRPKDKLDVEELSKIRRNK